jgi:DNA-binding response OmpR family regulator
MKRTFLLIGDITESQWPLVLQQALSPLGELHIAREQEAEQAMAQEAYDAIIVDAGAIHHALLLVSRLRAQHPQVRIIVATASPTWRRARQVLQAGAVDYIRKSLNKQELRSLIEAVLELPPPPQTGWDER